MTFTITNKQFLFTLIQKGMLCFLLLFIFSCNNDDDITSTPIEDTLNGLWFSAEKGYIIELKDGNDILYNINKIGCAIQDNDLVIEDFEGFILNQTSENELVASSDLSDIDVVFTRLSEQNPFCLPDQEI